MSEKWPSVQEPCYDCGSTLEGRHTRLCDMAGPNDKRDLPQVNEHTQHWIDSPHRKPKTK